MAFIPPPYDRDFARARNEARAARVAGDMRKPMIGAGVVAAVWGLAKRLRRRASRR